MYRYVTMQFISLPDDRLKSNLKLGIKSSSKSISRLSKDIFKEYLFQQISFSFRFYFSDTTFSIALHFANVSVNWVEETGNNLMIYFLKKTEILCPFNFPFFMWKYLKFSKKLKLVFSRNMCWQDLRHKQCS